MSPLEIGIPQGSPISPILFLIYIRFLFNINIEEIRRSQTNSEVSDPEVSDSEVSDPEVSDSEVSDSEEGSISKVLIRKPSYIDDIGIVVSSKSLETNARYLEIIAKTIFQKGKSNVIQFDQEKIELIHFHFSRKPIDQDNQNLWVRLEGYNIKS
jgi:Reverse transcriptase (RNA-dependent DNA polymerase)